jgi:hypothetical protein
MTQGWLKRAARESVLIPDTNATSFVWHHSCTGYGQHPAYEKVLGTDSLSSGLNHLEPQPQFLSARVYIAKRNDNDKPSCYDDLAKETCKSIFKRVRKIAKSG